MTEIEIAYHASRGDTIADMTIEHAVNEALHEDSLEGAMIATHARLYLKNREWYQANRPPKYDIPEIPASVGIRSSDQADGFAA